MKTPVPVTSLPKAHCSVVSAWQTPKAPENTTNNWHLQIDSKGTNYSHRYSPTPGMAVQVWGFLADGKTATWANWSGLQFQKTPWSWAGTGMYGYYLLQIEIMMFCCYESSCSYYCFWRFALLLQHRVWWRDFALRCICKITPTSTEVFYPWEFFCEMMCVGRVEAVREEQREGKSGSIKKESVSSRCTAPSHHHCMSHPSAGARAWPLLQPVERIESDIWLLTV